MSRQNIASSARFCRRARLVAKIDYNRVFQRPEKSSDRFFTVLARANEKHDPRLGLAISRKSVRSAVQRNRIKRVVRESFRQHQQIFCGIDIVVISRSQLARYLASGDNAEIFMSLQRHWRQLAKKFAV